MAQSDTDSAQNRVAVFLDRDGVINRRAPEGDYIRNREDFSLLPGVVGALRELHRAGAALFVVTNQRGVARGLIDTDELAAMHQLLSEWLAEADVPLAGVFVCPHEIGECDCRKPKVGLFEQALAANPWIALSRSHMIGDSLSDLEAGNRIGATAWLVGEEREAVVEEARRRGLAVAGQAATLADLVANAGIVPMVRGA